MLLLSTQLAGPAVVRVTTEPQLTFRYVAEDAAGALDPRRPVLPVTVPERRRCSL